MYSAYKIVHRLFLYPYLLSPLRSVPGPPLGNPFVGQASKLSAEDSGEYQREWIKEHGSIIRVVGPIGMERLMFLSPEALQQILVKGWLDYPRVRKHMLLSASVHWSNLCSPGIFGRFWAWSRAMVY